MRYIVIQYRAGDRRRVIIVVWTRNAVFRVIIITTLERTGIFMVMRDNIMIYNRTVDKNIDA